jgi:hypothetical protein
MRALDASDRHHQISSAASGVQSPLSARRAGMTMLAVAA